MTRKKDARSIRTEHLLKSAFLDQVAQVGYDAVTIAGLCKQAAITRSTFYLHYDHIGQMADELIDDALLLVGDIPIDLCSDCSIQPHTTEQRKPFCHWVLNESRLQPLFTDPILSENLIERCVDRSLDDFAAALGLTDKYTHEQIRALAFFRMHGCLSAARMIEQHGGSWNSVQSMLDQFIAGGFTQLQQSDTRAYRKTTQLPLKGDTSLEA